MTAYDLSITDGGDDARVVVELGGEVDLTNVGELERRLEEAVAPRSRVVLDLNRVTFLDSAALHLLFRLARHYGGRERFAIVVEPNALIARVLDMVGLKEVATIAPSADELRPSSPESA